MGFGSLIGTIITNIFSNQLYASEVSFIDKINTKCFRRNIEKWCRSCEVKYNGTILCSSKFERYISHYKPIEKIFSNVLLDQGKSVDKDTFIIKELGIFRNMDSENLDAFSHSDFKNFMSALYDKIDSFCRKKLSSDQKYLLSSIVQAKEEIKASNDSNADKVIQTVREESAIVRDDFKQVIGILNEKNQLTDNKSIWKIYSTLQKMILAGRCSEVKEMLPLLENKNASLEAAINCLLCLFGNEKHKNIDIEKLAADIVAESIYTDVVEKIIYISLVSNNREILKKISERNRDLFDIAHCLLENKKDVFISVETKREDGVSFFEYKILNNYPSNSWLVKRICMLELLQSNVINASQGILEVIGISSVLIDRVLLMELKVRELHNKRVKDDNEINSLIKEIEEINLVVNGCPEYIQEDYYFCMIQACLLVSIDKARDKVESIPKLFREHGKISMLVLQLNMDKSNTSVDEIMTACIKNDEYWLFNNYLLDMVDKKLFEEAKLIIEKYRFVIERSITVFLTYVQLVLRVEGRPSAEKLCSQYQEIYDDSLEFWMFWTSISKSVSMLEELEKRWMNNELQACDYHTTANLIILLFEYNHYNIALQVMDRYEKIDQLDNQLLRYKAIALLQLKHEIEALNIFRKLYSEAIQDEEIIYYIMAIALRNNREISSNVVDEARKSIDYRILSLLANYEMRKSNRNESLRLMRQAIMLCNNEDDYNVWGQYMSIYTAFINDIEKQEISNVDIGTVITLYGNEEKLVYCIHEGRNLPADNYSWQSAIHIGIESAVKLNLYRKKVGDTVTIEGNEYEIVEIDSLEIFFFHKSMEKLVESGGAKIIETRIDTDGNLDADSFKRQFKELVGDSKPNNEWLEQYQKLNEIPAPLYACKKMTKLTYLQLVGGLIDERYIIYRETRFEDQGISCDQFILTTSSFVALSKIGFDSQLKKKVFIPSSLKRIVEDDTEKVLQENKADRITSMGVIDEDIFCIEEPGEQRKKKMLDAISMKDFLDCFEIKENNKDLDEKKMDLKAAFGIVDYDALLLAENEDLTLVASEVPIALMTKINGKNIKCVCIAEFLAKQELNWRDILRYIDELLKHHFNIPFSREMFVQLCEQYIAEGNETQKEIEKRWSDILKTSEDDLQYRANLVGDMKEILSATFETNIYETVIWKMFMRSVLYYAGQEIKIFMTRDGRITAQLVPSAHLNK